MPTFSVIIPLYNKAHYIANTIETVLSQKEDSFELIIIDDGSTDNGAAIVKRFDDPRIQLIKTDHLGVSAARNKGIELATGTFITFLDADDLWKPTFLAEIKKATCQFPHALVFATAIEKKIGNRTLPARYSLRKNTQYQEVNYFEASMKDTIICTSAAAFHPRVFKHVGCFDNKLKSGQDTDMWIRIGMQFPVVFINQILATYFFTPNSLSKQPKHLAAKADFSRFNKAAEDNKALRHFLDYNLFSLAIQAKTTKQSAIFEKIMDELRNSSLPPWRKLVLYLPSSVIQILQTIKRRR